SRAAAGGASPRGRRRSCPCRRALRPGRSRPESARTAAPLRFPCRSWRSLARECPATGRRSALPFALLRVGAARRPPLESDDGVLEVAMAGEAVVEGEAEPRGGLPRLLAQLRVLALG